MEDTDSEGLRDTHTEHPAGRWTFWSENKTGLALECLWQLNRMETMAHRGRVRRAERPRPARDGKGVPGKRQRSRRIPETGAGGSQEAQGLPPAVSLSLHLEDSGYALPSLDLSSLGIGLGAC